MDKEESKRRFIAKSIEKYGADAFDYSLVEYVNGYTDITLTCKKHGNITLTPAKHLDIVGGCPFCSRERRKKRKTMDNEEYKKLVILKHGDKYDLSRVEYTGMKECVTGICPEHGEFNIVAYDFAKLRGCPKCGAKGRFTGMHKKDREKRHERLTNETFIAKGKELFNDYYDYSKTDLGNKDEKGRVLIICPKHGEFWQNPNSHVKGHGCAKCGKEKGGKSQSMTTEEFVRKSSEVHHFKYDYSDTVYNGCHGVVDIICPIHGKFSQKAYVHLNGHGCKKCANEAVSDQIISNTEDFIEKAKNRHSYENNDYSFVNYKGAKMPVTIVCENGHTYSQMPNKHLSGHGCPYCSHVVSNPEKEITGFIESLGLDVVNNKRSVLFDAREIDMVVPSKNVAIEYDGLYWHSERTKPSKTYHLDKTVECGKNGMRLIHIFEDEWLYKREIVESRLRVILGGELERIYARKCVVRPIENDLCAKFLEQNHIQGGNVRSSIRYGLFHDNELVSVMTFCKPRKNLGRNANEGDYELLRFCNKLNATVIGGASKLFKHFVRENDPKTVISYADRRWNTGQVYETLGFDFSHFSQPNYFYIIGQKRYNRFNFRKDILVRQGFDSTKTEHQIMLDRGIYRIYDCGTLVYKWTSEVCKY